MINSAASLQNLSTTFDLTRDCFKAAGFVFMDFGLTRHSASQARVNALLARAPQ
jgi:hypothetical protein